MNVQWCYSSSTPYPYHLQTLVLGETIFGGEKNQLINPDFSSSKWAGVSAIPTSGSESPRLRLLSTHRYMCRLHCYGRKCSWNAGWMSRFQTITPHANLVPPRKPVSPTYNYFNYSRRSKIMETYPRPDKCPSYLLFPVITARGEHEGCYTKIRRMSLQSNTWCQA